PRRLRDARRHRPPVRRVRARAARGLRDHRESAAESRLRELLAGALRQRYEPRARVVARRAAAEDREGDRSRRPGDRRHSRRPQGGARVHIRGRRRCGACAGADRAHARTSRRSRLAACGRRAGRRRVRDGSRARRWAGAHTRAGRDAARQRGGRADQSDRRYPTRDVRSGHGADGRAASGDQGAALALVSGRRQTATCGCYRIVTRPDRLLRSIQHRNRRVGLTETAPLYFAPGAVLAAAIILGGISGYAFQRIWRRILPRPFSRDVLKRLPADVRAMLTAEEPSEMLKHYKAVLAGILGWSARNAAGLAFGLMPAAAAFLLLAAWDPSARLAAQIELYPVEETLSPAAARSPWMLEAGRMLAERDAVTASGLVVGANQRIGARRIGDKHAFCSSVPKCALFEMMLFDAELAPDLDRSLVVRPAAFDLNPAWPYVHDLELAFFAAVMLGSAGAALARRGRQCERPGICGPAPMY